MKRFQECNWIVKLWRYRHYLYIPFKWLYWSLIDLKVHHHENPNEFDIIQGKGLWRILLGSAQGDMAWYHTMEEVKEYFKNK